MKKIYFLLPLLAIYVLQVNGQQTWDNFEDIRQTNYGFINGTFIPYNENPDPAGINTSLVAAKYTRNASETFDVLILNRVMANVTDYATGSKTMSMDIWSPAVGTTVQITLENTSLAMNPYPTGRHSEYQAVTTVAEQWETLEFSLTGTPDANVAPTILNQLVLLFAPNTNTNDTYYWDNLQGPEFAVDACEGIAPNANILNDFECHQNVNYIFSHSGINFQRILNPDSDGNPSSHVARYVRNGGEENDVIIGRFDGALGLSANSAMSLDVWDPNAPTTVIVSLQNNAGNVILAMSAETSVSSTWQTLSYDPSEVFEATDITQFVVLFDPGASTSDEYYFDNFNATNTTAIDELEAVVSFKAYPNPSNGATTFEYELKNSANVIYDIMDITGKVVEQNNLGIQAAGSNQVLWNANDYSNGIYFYNFRIDGQIASGKIVLNR
ncbi:T9SS type A sorting domain-containing protein [Cryomorpha ignava]|uniref:T9SS type A sorting domain-containing protein n=1 Tax=Cryomorpha ignava TaxID=101383 RepID=A0A7K3WM34_9FLAO|nr:T9SS type A sorting domain-containing protein [Cryomorpha ignava]NEN22706.1 T9SS type A sorting domain-containing protein [Cryomorpha ignava]